MINVRRLFKLSPLHRARKAAQVLGHLEADYRNGSTASAPWILELARAFAMDAELPDYLRELFAFAASGAGSLALTETEAGARLVNRLARGLEAHAGFAPADWDFREPLGLTLASGSRKVFPGLEAYLEDIRSPFNVGSIFRTADAFGFSRLYLSGFCADPSHARAERAAMGATAIVPWSRTGLDLLDQYKKDAVPIIALELRGISIDEFEFPDKGLVLMGSEELGVSPEAIDLCSSRVSIPMLGAKGSLNVGVAFGVLANAWRQSLVSRGIGPL